MSFVDEKMTKDKIKNNNVSFDLNDSLVLVKLTEAGEEIIKTLDPTGKRKKNSEGYYEIFSNELFTLYRSLLMRKSYADISDLISEPVLIDTIFLKDENNIAVSHRLR